MKYSKRFCLFKATTSLPKQCIKIWYWLISGCLDGLVARGHSQGPPPAPHVHLLRTRAGDSVAWWASDPHVLILSPSRPSSPHCSFAITTTTETLTSAPCPPIRLSRRCCRLSVLWLQNGGLRRRVSLWALSRQQQQRGGHFLLLRVQRHDAMARVQQGAGDVIKRRCSGAPISMSPRKRLCHRITSVYLFNNVRRGFTFYAVCVRNNPINANFSILHPTSISSVCSLRRIPSYVLRHQKGTPFRHAKELISR